MAKFGEFVFSTAKFGTGDAEPQPVHTGNYLYVLNIKWGTTWVNEAGRLVDVQGTRGRQFYVGKTGETFEYMQPGEFTFLMDDYDRRFDSWNDAGALYGLLEPGKAVEFSVKYLPTGISTHIFTGHIKDVRPTSRRDQAQIIVDDDLQWLADQTITIPQAQNIKVHEAIQQTLTAAKYPFAKSLANSNCPITYFDPEEANALDTIRSLSDAGLGTVFADRHGILTYYDFSKTGQPTHTLDQAVLKKEITTNQRWDTVRNKITCVANRYGYSPAEVIWRMDERLTLIEGQTKTFKIEFENSQVIQPVRGVDYWSASTLEGFVPGVGYTSTFYFISVYLSDITSTSATVNVVNAAPGGAAVASIIVRGCKLVNKKVPYTKIDATSMAKGPRSLRIDSPWLQDKAFAEAYATTLLAHLKNPSKDPVITLDTRPDGLGIDLLDRLTLTSAKLGINNTYDVGGIDYHWLSSTGQAFEQTFHLQTVLYSTMAITPEPFIPPGPEIGPPEPPVLVNELDACLSLTGTNLTTGPYAWTSGTIYSDNPTQFMLLQKWIRAASHPKRTYIEVDGLWEIKSGGVWVPNNSFDFDTVAMLDRMGNVVASGSLAGGLVSNGVRTYQFDNAMEEYAQVLKLAIPTISYAIPDVPADIFDRTFRGTMTTLVPGTEVLKSGTLTATLVSGTTYYADKIHVDDLYGEGILCLETTGPLDYGDASALRMAYWGAAVYRRNNNVQVGSSSGREVETNNGAPYSDSGWFSDTGDAQSIIQSDNVNGYNARVFFEVIPDPYYQGTVPSNHWYIAANPYNPSANAQAVGPNLYGSPTYQITRALEAVGSGDYRVTIRSIKIYNVCEE